MRDPRHLEAVVEGVFEAAQAANLPGDLPDRLRRVCGVLVRLLGCDRSSIFLLDGDRYRAFVNWGNPPDVAALFGDAEFPVDVPLLRMAAQSPTFVVVNDAPVSPLLPAGLAALARIEAIVVVALRDVEGRPIGFLTAEFNDSPRRFTRLQSLLVSGIGSLVALAVVAERALEERRALLPKLAELHEAERARLATSLREGIAQSIAAVHLAVESAAVLPDGRGALQRVSRVIAETLEQVRSLSIELRPSVLDHFGLVPALAALLQRFDGAGVRCELRTDGPVRRLSEETESVVFRLAEEWLTSRTGRGRGSVRASLRFDERWLRLELEADAATDDGDATSGPVAGRESASRREDVGMLVLRERVCALRGEFDLTDSDGHARLRVRLPLEERTPPDETR